MLVVAALVIITAIMAGLALQIQVKTVFDDLLPRNHPYIAVHNQFKQTFGGSNVISIMLEVEQGDIFVPAVLGKIQKVTRDLERVDGVNQFQIISLASKKLREIRASTEGVEVRPLMWPELPKNQEEIARLREAVLNSPLVYGPYVSIDLKAALITADFYDQLLDYHKVFKQVRDIAGKVAGDGVRVRVVGEPVLYGWVNYYLTETLYILLITLACLVLLLFFISRTWRGTVLPLLAGLVSAAWALGTARLMGFHLDPLVIVVAFLITARAISHSVQLVTRFEDEIAAGAPSTEAAARASMLGLFRPGMLGVVADAGCMIVVVLTPIPLLEKVAIIGAMWVFTIAVSAVVLTPVLLSWVKRPPPRAHALDMGPVLGRFLRSCAALVTSRARYALLAAAAVIFAGSGIYAFKLKVGDANPGSPILWPDSTYNQDAAAINRQFQGSDRMFVAVAGTKSDALKEPAVLESVRQFQKFMEAQPEVGGSLSIADILPAVKRTLREGNPRYEEFGNNANENGELLYLYVSGTEPGDIDRFADARVRNGSVTLFFRDHQGETIRTAISRVREFAEKHPVTEAEYRLAGGLIGVLAAANEVILAGQIESIALAMLVLMICCAVTYRSVVAGMFFLVPVMLSNTITFSYMAWKGIGMNINTLPIAALGIGLGVDYAFYIVDGIREELRKHGDLSRSIAKSLASAGRGVVITAATLTLSVVLWWWSSLRFQAEMGLLMALWLFVSAVSALFLMPAMVFVFRPRFIIGKRIDPVSVAVTA